MWWCPCTNVGELLLISTLNPNSCFNCIHGNIQIESVAGFPVGFFIGRGRERGIPHRNHDL